MASEEHPGSIRDPRVWGPHFWKVYDIIAETYPVRPSSDEKKAAERFFKSQVYLIPCERCARNYRAIYKANPPRLRSRAQLQEWVALLKKRVAEHSKQ